MARYILQQFTYMLLTITVVIVGLVVLLNNSAIHQYPTTLELFTPYLQFVVNGHISSDLAGIINNIGAALGASGIILGLSICLVITASFSLGLYSGWIAPRYIRNSIRGFNTAISSIPEFIIAIVVSLLYTYFSALCPQTEKLIRTNGINAVLLPVIVLTLYHTAYMTRVVDNATQITSNMSYIRYASLQGMPKRAIFYNFVYRNALKKPLSIFFSHINWIISGLIIIEIYFQYDGVGNLVYQSALYGNTQSMFASVTVVIIIVSFMRFVSDVFRKYILDIVDA